MQFGNKILQTIAKCVTFMSHLKQRTMLIFLELFLYIIEGKKHRIMRSIGKI
jgi:hypothetical protein